MQPRRSQSQIRPTSTSIGQIAEPISTRILELRPTGASARWGSGSAAVAAPGRPTVLTDALAQGVLSCVFQPIVDLRSREIVGYEALARFATVPVRSPDVWFAEANAQGCAIELELAAIDCALAAYVSPKQGTYLSLNASPETVVSGELARRVVASRCPIVVELTEHAVVDDYAELSVALDTLRRLGARVAIDDAGSGFASLRHVIKIHPEIIKLDMELVRGVDSNPELSCLVAALSGFAVATGAALIAEGIETDLELNALTTCGVGTGQGYLLGRPGILPAASAPAASPPTARSAPSTDAGSDPVVGSITVAPHLTPSTIHARLRARSAALMWFAGTLMGAGELPRLVGDRWGWALATVLVLVGAIAATATSIGWRHLTDAHFHANSVGGIVAVAALIVVEPQISELLTFMLLWIALFAAVFFRGRQQVFQYALVGATCVLGVVVTDQPQLYLYALATLAVAAVFTGTLVAELERSNSVDPLTDLPNRRAWNERLTLEMARTLRTGEALCIGMIDLDHFKRYNDTHGHGGGDRLLVTIAGAWSRLLRREDMIARLGGEEFGVLLTACALGNAQRALEQLKVAESLGATWSGGVAQWDRNESAEELTARADAALYEAKAAGRDRVVAASGRRTHQTAPNSSSRTVNPVQVH